MLSCHEHLAVRLDVLLYRAIEWRQSRRAAHRVWPSFYHACAILVASSGRGDLVRYDLSEVLESRVESHLWVDALLVFFSQVESVDEVRGRFTLCIGRGNERGELVVANILAGWQLDHVQQRLFFAYVREQGYKFGVSVLSLSQSCNDAFLSLDHLSHECRESSFIFTIAKWQNHIDTSNVVVPRYARLISET